MRRARKNILRVVTSLYCTVSSPYTSFQASAGCSSAAKNAESKAWCSLVPPASLRAETSSITSLMETACRTLGARKTPRRTPWPWPRRRFSRPGTLVSFRPLLVHLCLQHPTKRLRLVCSAVQWRLYAEELSTRVHRFYFAQ